MLESDLDSLLTSSYDNLRYVISNGRGDLLRATNLASFLYAYEVEEEIDVIKIMKLVICLVIVLPLPFAFWCWVRPAVRNLYEAQEEVLKLLLEIPPNYIRQLRDHLERIAKLVSCTNSLLFFQLNLICSISNFSLYL